MALPWKDDPRITHRSFRIVDLVEVDDIIRGKVFEDCTIYGPAVVVPLGNGTFDSCVFGGDFEALFWEIPETRTAIVGGIGVIDCTFLRCTFLRIGFAGNREFGEMLKRGARQ